MAKEAKGTRVVGEVVGAGEEAEEVEEVEEVQKREDAAGGQPEYESAM